MTQNDTGFWNGFTDGLRHGAIIAGFYLVTVLLGVGSIKLVHSLVS